MTDYKRQFMTLENNMVFNFSSPVNQDCKPAAEALADQKHRFGNLFKLSCKSHGYSACNDMRSSSIVSFSLLLLLNLHLVATDTGLQKEKGRG
jgi:hypothetical protein